MRSIKEAHNKVSLYKKCTVTRVIMIKHQPFQFVALCLRHIFTSFSGTETHWSQEGRPGSGHHPHQRRCETGLLPKTTRPISGVVRRIEGRLKPRCCGWDDHCIFFTSSKNLLWGDNNSGISTGCWTSALQPPGHWIFNIIHPWTLHFLPPFQASLISSW